jgi:dephospho-CoA kinase
VVAPGTEGLAAVVRAFGDGVLGAGGGLDREALRRRVFADAAQRRLLESLLHPRIRASRADWVARLDREGHRLAVAEVPLLFETGMEREFEVVVLVDAPREERLRRLVAHRGLGEAEAQAIMAAQMPAGEKRSRASYVLENGGTMQELEERALALLDLLLARARRGGGS